MSDPGSQLVGQGFYRAYEVPSDGSVYYARPEGFEVHSLAIYNHSDQRVTVTDEGGRYPVYADPGVMIAHPIPPGPQWSIVAAAKFAQPTAFAYVDFSDLVRSFVFGLQGPAHNKVAFNIAAADITIHSFTLPRLSHQLVFEFTSVTSGGATAALFQITYTPPNAAQIILVSYMMIAPNSFPPPLYFNADFAAGTVINVNLQVAPFGVNVTMGY